MNKLLLMATGLLAATIANAGLTDKTTTTTLPAVNTIYSAQAFTISKSVVLFVFDKNNTAVRACFPNGGIFKITQDRLASMGYIVGNSATVKIYQCTKADCSTKTLLGSETFVIKKSLTSSSWISTPNSYTFPFNPTAGALCTS